MGTNRVSLNPSTFVQGGLVDDIDATISAAQFCEWDYGKGGETYLFFAITITDDEGKNFDQYYSAGDKTMFQPSEDGQYLVATGDRAAMSSSTNAAAFFKSLQDAGFPMARLDEMGAGEALIGMKAHFMQVAQPKRKGLIKTGQQSDDREKSTLQVTNIISLPGQVVAAAGKLGIGKKPVAGLAKPGVQTAAKVPASATATSPSNGAATAGDPEVDEVCTTTLMEILAENGGTVTKAKLPALAFQKLSKHPAKSLAVPRLYSIPFLSSPALAEMGIAFDGATVTMG